MTTDAQRFPLSTARRGSREGMAELAPSVILAAVVSYFADDWLAGLGVLVLWAIWKLLYQRGKSPVLALALSFQWTQVTCGIYYFAITGRQVEAMVASDYRTMVLIGLGCVVTLLAGILAGQSLMPAHWTEPRKDQRYGPAWRMLLVTYVVTLALGGLVREVAWFIPSLTQGLLAVGYLRMATLYLMLRRLCWPRFRANWFLGLVGLEVLLGFTGFFAGFREPLVLSALAFAEVFDRRSLSHWLRLGALTAVMIVTGVVWMGIRDTYRGELQTTTSLSTRSARMERVGSLSNTWLESSADEVMSDIDALVERLWAIYYPALTVSRVPEAVPHENGGLMVAALRHIVTPRILFPDKPALPSDSELVRKYTGIPVAGPDQNTTIAFGYAAEAYVDFGLPWMFLPTLLFGLFMGMVYRYLFHVIHHHELAVGLVTVVFWLSLYPWERSWAMTLGLSITLVLYLGAVVFFVDRWLERHTARMKRVAIRGGSLSRRIR